MEKIRTMVKSRLAGERRAVTAALMLLAGFLSSFGRILNFPSCMNVAVAALSGGNILPVFGGSVLAYALMGDVSTGMVQLCSMLMLAGIEFIIPADRLTLFGRRSEPVFTALSATSTLMLFGCVMSVASPSDSFTVSLRMINALLCGCTVYTAMMLRGSKALSGAFELGGINGIYVSILYIMVISTLTSLSPGIINPGRALGCFCMLMAVRRYHQTGGAVVGALTTCGVLMCTPMLAKNTLLLATSGLICGVFWSVGMTVTVLIFLSVSLISLVAMGVNSDTFPMFADMLVGSLAFIAMPLPIVKKLGKRVSGFRSPVDIVSQTTSSKLSFASNTIGEIRGQLSQVNAAIKRSAKHGDLCTAVISRVCGSCPYCAGCLIRREQVEWSLGKLERICTKYNCISREDVEKLLGCCRCPTRMSEMFNRIYADRVAQKAGSIRMNEMRELLGEQLSSMQDVLKDLSLRVGQVRNIDASLSSQVRNCFDQLGYPNAKVCVFVDSNMCQRVEVYLTAQFCGDIARLTTLVSSAAGCDLDIPTVTRADELTRISFCEAAAYEAELATFSASRSGEYSGDSYDIFDVSPTEKYVVLSDGMGTGKRARLDSVFSVSLVSRLIRCGMSVTTAQKMVNSMLRVKGWEESFATLDILRLDLYGGSAGLMKSGAAPSYLCRDGGLKAFSSDAFPAGILAGCAPDVADFKLFDGDIIMLASDGVQQRIARQLCAMSQQGLEIQKICACLGAMCTDSDGGEMRDDVTIILVKITKKQA